MSHLNAAPNAGWSHQHVKGSLKVPVCRLKMVNGLVLLEGHNATDDIDNTQVPKKPKGVSNSSHNLQVIETVINSSLHAAGRDCSSVAQRCVDM